MSSIPSLIGRIAFGVIVIASFLLFLKTADSRSTLFPQSQTKDRLVTKRPWRVEPVKVISAKSKRKEKIDIGKPFQEEDDWLDGFTITVSNDSDKPVTAIVVSLVFAREPGDTRNKFAEDLSFGPSPISPAYSRRDPTKLIKPGKSADLIVQPDIYRSINDALQTLGYPESVSQVEITIREVGFDDGSVLLSGKLYLQDPENPTDPTKKVPADKSKQRATTIIAQAMFSAIR